MRILFTNGRQTYPLFQGGDGISLHHLFSLLAQKNHSILAVGRLNPPHIPQTPGRSLRLLSRQGIKPRLGSDSVSFTVNGYRNLMIHHRSFIASLPRIITSFNPEVVLTQLDHSQDIVRICTRQKRKVVLFVHDHDPLNYLSLNQSRHMAYVIFNSQSTFHHYRHLLHCPGSVIYPPIRLEDYLCSSRQPEFITLINPTRLKGVQIAETLAGLLPKEKFLFVRGWRTPELSRNLPQNLTVIKRQYDMRPVYSRPQTLLVPSQWEEAFGRVIPEAGINQIPIVASRIGGIPEALGEGGLLVDAFTDPQAWLTAVNLILSDSDLALKLGALARRRSRKFSLDRISRQIISVLDTVNRS